MSTKRTKGLAIILALVIISTIMPTSVFASNNPHRLTSDAIKEIIQQEYDKNRASNVIISEVISKRDEYSKTYLLEDGSYYCITSNYPVHYSENNEWVSVDDELDCEFGTIDEAESSIQELSFNEFANSPKLFSINPPSNISGNSLTISSKGELSLNNSVYQGNLISNNKSYIFVKPNTVFNYSANDLLVLEANINFNVTTNRTTNVNILAYEEKYDWENNLDDYSLSNNLELLDKLILKTRGASNCSLNITDAFSKWERETINNHGITLCFYSTGNNLSNLGNFTISIRYKDIYNSNIDCTYHTLDLGRAGIVSINDITNSVSVSQSLVGIESEILPVNIERIINSTQNDLSTNGNVGGQCNYSYNLDYDNDIITWSMPNNKKIIFTESDETVNDYAVWKSNYNYDDISLYIPSNAMSDLYNLDYSTCYIESINEKFNFNTNGNLISIEKDGKAIQIAYGNKGISLITDTNGVKYIFNYDSYTFSNNRYYYVKEILVKDSNNQIITLDNQVGNNSVDENKNYDVNISTYYDEVSDYIVSEEVFPDDSVVKYFFNTNGLLKRIINSDDSIVDFDYKSETNNYLVSYCHYIINENDEHKIIDSLQIDSSDTYYRTFIDKDNKTENYDYNFNYQLMTHVSKSNSTTCIYYEGENIYSYAFDEDEESVLQNYDFSSEPSDQDWQFEDIDNVTYNERYNCINISPHEGEVYINQYLEPDVSETSNDGVVFPEGTTLVVDVNASVQNTYPFDKKTSFAGVIVSVGYKNDGYEDFILPLDTSLDNKTQTRKMAFTLKDDCNYICYSILVFNQVGTVTLNYANMFVSKEAITDPFGIEMSDTFYTEFDNDGRIIKKEISNNDNSLSLIQTFQYYANNIQCITDYDGIKKYYKYNPLTNQLIASGNTIDEDGEIVEPTTYTYDSINLLREVSSTITSTINGENIIKSNYSYDSNNNITSICLNDLKYDYDYDETGNVSSVTLSNSSDSEDTSIELQNLVYTDDDNIGSIHYANDSSVIFEYNNDGKISKIEYFDASEQNDEEVIPVVKFEYSYNQDNISEVICTKNHYQTSKVKIKFANDSYQLYNLTNENDSENSTLIYDSSKEDNIQTQKYYNPDENAQNKYEQFNTTYSTNNSSNSINITGSKQFLWGRSTNTFNININSTKDDFGRCTMKNFSGSQTSSSSGTNNVSILNNSSYKSLEDNVTSNLIDQQTIVISANGTQLSSNTKKYSYDNHGNLHFVFSVNGNNEYSLEEYYEYDSMNQLIYSFINTGSSSKKSYEKYYYDKYGNLVEKISYDSKPEITVENTNDPNVIELMSDIFYSTNISENSIDFGILKDICISMDYNNYKKTTYLYDNIYHNRMISYKESEFTKIYGNDEESNNDFVLQETVLVDSSNISYDSNGNPNEYIGYDSSGNLFMANLKWQGNNLIELEKLDNNGNISSIFTYSYDQNGYRIEKCRYYMDSNNEKVLSNKIQYIWENGVLQSLIFTGDIQKFRSNVPIDNTKIAYSKILYDSDGNPSGYITPSGIMYGFVKDIKGNITRLVQSDGDETIKISYDAFGNIKFDNPPKLSDCLNNVNLWLEVYNAYLLTAQFNPCTFKGYLLDYESGMYFSKSQCYSPTWNRFISTESDYSKLQTPSYNTLDNNPYLFCNNNPISNDDYYASWSTYKQNIELFENGFSVAMSKAFLSRSFCTIYALQLIKQFGNWNFECSNNILNMDVERISTNLFARAVGYYVPNAINRVNANWGIGWLKNVSVNDNIISINCNEKSHIIYNYKQIWRAAPSIKNYAWSNGIFITL